VLTKPVLWLCSVASQASREAVELLQSQYCKPSYVQHVKGCQSVSLWLLCLCSLLQEGCGLQLLAVLLSPEEASELQLQQAYLAYLWGRAALMGVEPQASKLDSCEAFKAHALLGCSSCVPDACLNCVHEL
jgi:hypothetical protein